MEQQPSQVAGAGQTQTSAMKGGTTTQPAQQPNPRGMQQGVAPQQKKKSKWWIWLLVILGIIIVVGAVILF